MYAKGTFSKLRLNFHITLRPGKKKMFEPLSEALHVDR